MGSTAIALIVFAGVFGGALLGMFLRTVMPEHHLSDDSKDVVKVVTGLVATLSALVLGLLIASAKSSFDTVNDEFRQGAAKVILLDRVLAQYGPEAKAVRDLLRSALAAKVALLFPEDKSKGAGLKALQGAAQVETIEERLRALSPANDAQRSLQSRALQLAADVEEMRWLGLEQAHSSMPTPFVAVLVCWLALMFLGFGLFAPRNAVALGALVVGALSVSTAVFLIEELNDPLGGSITISSAPLRSALANIGK